MFLSKKIALMILLCTILSISHGMEQKQTPSLSKLLSGLSVTTKKSEQKCTSLCSPFNGPQNLSAAIARQCFTCCKKYIEQDHVKILPDHLCTAVNESSPEIVELLLSHEANPNHLTADETTLIYTCLQRSKDRTQDKNKIFQIIRLLLLYGANPNSPSHDIPPLHLSSRICKKEISLLLILGGADIEGTDNFGQTPLICATQANNLENVTLFLELPFYVAELRSIAEQIKFLCIFDDPTKTMIETFLMALKRNALKIPKVIIYLIVGEALEFPIKKEHFKLGQLLWKNNCNREQTAKDYVVTMVNLHDKSGKNALKHAQEIKGVTNKKNKEKIKILLEPYTIDDKENK